MNDIIDKIKASNASSLRGDKSYKRLYSVLSENGKKYEVQKLFFSNQDKYLEQKINDEIELIKLINSPHIHRKIKIIENNMIYIIQEELDSNIFNYDYYLRYYSLSLEEKMTSFFDVCKAVYSLHEHGYTHNHIKLRNVAICEKEGRYYGLLVNIGSATKFKEEEFDNFTTPEERLYNGLKAKIQRDIYALGIVLYYIFQNRFPKDTRNFSRLDFVENKENKMSKGIYDIYMKLTASSSLERYQNMAEVLEDIIEYYNPIKKDKNKNIESDKGSNSEEGYEEMMYKIGNTYSYDKDIEPIFQKACSFNHRKGYIYCKEYRVFDSKKAELYYKEAIQKNHPEATCNYGFIFEEKKDFEQAKYWYNKAISLGSKRALIELALLKVLEEYENSNHEDIKKLLLQGVKNKDHDTMFYLGMMYEYYATGESDHKLALSYYKQSALYENTDAMARLGTILLGETKSIHNTQEALRLSQIGTELNNRYATANLGWIYEYGLAGLEKDEEKAKKLYDHSGNMGNPEAFLYQASKIDCRGRFNIYARKAYEYGLDKALEHISCNLERTFLYKRYFPKEIRSDEEFEKLKKELENPKSFRDDNLLNYPLLIKEMESKQKWYLRNLMKKQRFIRFCSIPMSIVGNYK